MPCDGSEVSRAIHSSFLSFLVRDVRRSFEVLVSWCPSLWVSFSAERFVWLDVGIVNCTKPSSFYELVDLSTHHIATPL